MTVKQLREMLATLNQDMQVLAFDVDANNDYPVSGYVYVPESDAWGPHILLQTDEL